MTSLQLLPFHPFVSSKMSSYGWFNTALMVEGKTYLPWLMDW